MEVVDLQGVGRFLRNSAACPLDEYEARGLLGSGKIGQERYEAGKTFGADFHHVFLGPKTTAYDKLFIDGSLPLTEAQQVSIERWREAYDYLSTRSKSLALWVICFDGYTKDWCQQHKYSRHYGMDKLRETLDELLEYYNLSTPKKENRHSRS